MEVDDAGYWQRSLEGDGDSFGLLFDRHRDRVFRHAKRLAESTADAEDVTAAAFLELWRRRRAVRLVNGSVLPWLLVTTTNLWRNQRRASRRYRNFLSRLPREIHADSAETALDRDPFETTDVRLGAALRALSTQDQHLFTLVALEGYSIADAAAVLQVSPSAAKTRLHRARQRLRADLAGEAASAPHTLAIRGES